ncbi:thioredoxin family protein [Robiginitalea sp. IMCC43444]|uniref:thioredoxin family protein n=1 Tax=Robiginitalea sp. IMCC43444 TaxID=3459121 RepID=UPI004041DD4A
MKSHHLISICLYFSCIAVSAQQWHTDFPKAQAVAAKENKPIVLVFQGSDWCAPCIKLDREVWDTAIFKEFAASHFVMVKADFPRKKKNALPEQQAKANAALADHYNPNGVFPLVVIMDTKGRVKGRASYEKLGPEAYIAKLLAFIQSDP